MQGSHPTITFTLPFRLFTEDREFLGENFIRQIKKQLTPQDIDNLRLTTLYRVGILVQAYKPVEIHLTPLQLQKMVKPIFTNGKCLDIDFQYQQHRSRTMLPIVDIGFYT